MHRFEYNRTHSDALHANFVHTATLLDTLSAGHGQETARCVSTPAGYLHALVRATSAAVHMNEPALVLLLRLLVAVFMLRVWMQLVQVDYYNPVTNRFVRMLSPVVDTLGKVIRPVNRLNLAALVIALLVASGIMALFFPAGDPLRWLIGGLALSFSVTLSMIFWMLLAMVIASWVVSPQNPWFQLLHQLIQPILGPIQRVLPNLGGLDFSPIVLFLLIQLLRGAVESRLFLLSGLGGL